MKILVIDIETLGLKISDMIVEIGIVELNLFDGKIRKIFECICNESKKSLNKNAWIFNHSTLTYKEVKKAKNLLHYFNEIQSIFNKAYAITSFNQQFDLTRLKSRNFRIPKRIFDPMIILTDIMKIPHVYYGYKFPSVKEAYNYFYPFTEYIEKHRSLNDCYYEAKICYKVYELLKKDYLPNKKDK